MKFTNSPFILGCVQRNIRFYYLDIKEHYLNKDLNCGKKNQCLDHAKYVIIFHYVIVPEKYKDTSMLGKV